MYNLDARYKIIGRVMRGQTVLAYAVVDRHTNAKTLIAKNIAEEMALNKQFVNCFGQVYDNNINLKGIGCKLNQLPKYNEHGELIEIEEKHKKRMNDLRLIGKIQQGRNVVAYVLEAVNKAAYPGEIKKSRQETLELARDGRIINAKCQIYEGKLMLRAANGYSLNNLKVMQVK